jgi:hypothetical protein
MIAANYFLGAALAATMPKRFRSSAMRRLAPGVADDEQLAVHVADLIFDSRHARS